MSDRHSGAGIQTKHIEESSRTFDRFSNCGTIKAGNQLELWEEE
jgi:hypothetical protein